MQNVDEPVHSEQDASQGTQVNPSEELTKDPAGQVRSQRLEGVRTNPGRQAEQVIWDGVETMLNEGMEQEVHVEGQASQIPLGLFATNLVP